MQHDLDGLVQEATNVFHLVDSVLATCQLEHEHQTYLPASETFFDYIKAIAEASRDYIESYLVLAQHHPDFQSKFYGFVQINGFWSTIHQLVKPAADADTLNIPIPLIQAAEIAVRRIPGLESTQLVVVLSSELNYLQYTHAYFERLAEALRGIAPNAPAFPSSLAIIGIPYSQSTRLFTNVAVFHELGHYAYQRLGIDKELGPAIDYAINSHLKSANLDPETHAWVASRLEQWCQEIFCDLFAVSLVGPLYAFATADFFRLISDQQMPRVYQFAVTHPADALRFRAMYRHLDKLGWIDELPSSFARLSVLRAYDSVKDQDFSFPQRSQDLTAILKPFFDVHDSLLKIVERVVGPAIESPYGFSAWIDPIGDCLGEAIVPSAAVNKGGTMLSKTTLLNAGYLFAATSIDKLCVSNGPTTPVSHRSRALRRLELWVMKSLEDHELLMRAAKN